MNNKSASQGVLEPQSDIITQDLLNKLSQQEGVKKFRVAGVRTILVVLSSRAMVFDRDALKQKLSAAYPDSTIFFLSSGNVALGSESPDNVDLIIDFSGPSERQPFLFCRKLRRVGKTVIGRNCGFFRKGLYDRVFDEKKEKHKLPKAHLDRERVVQSKVLELAGVATLPFNSTPDDLSKTLPLELPPSKG